MNEPTIHLRANRAKVKALMILNILRGRPVIYRLKFRGTLRIYDMNHAMFVECVSEAIADAP